MRTPFQELLNDLNGGVFVEQVGQALSQVALGVVTTGKKGKVVLTFDMAQIGNSSQIEVKHTLAFASPTHRGKQSEDAMTSTPLHVGKGGVLTLFPHEQNELFPKKEAV